MTGLWKGFLGGCPNLPDPFESMEQTAGRLPAGWKYVLPTEAQWEYACRAGTTTAYSWGATIASSNANYNWNGYWNTGNDFKQTRDVGQYAANPWGFFDMHGNVWEWVHDWKANYPGGWINPEVPLGLGPGPTWWFLVRRRDGLDFRPACNWLPIGFQAVQQDTANPELKAGNTVHREVLLSIRATRLATGVTEI